ncbi:ACT domain-containing protein, partial [Clostridium botulinum]|nr:ACT domain-containing protein [Clostridium botulinum]
VLECKNMNTQFEDVHKALNAKGIELGVEVKIQREEIFKSMHSL